MKRVIYITLSLLLLINITACAKQPAPPSQDTTPSTSVTVPTETTTVPTETTGGEELPIIPQPMVSVSLPMQNESITDDNGNVLMQYNTQYMIISMSEQEVADRITVEFLNRIDETIATKDSVLSAAKSAFKANNKNWSPYQYTVSYTPKRIDDGVLSLLGCNVSYLGAHIDKVYHSVNYSMSTGRNLSLLNIISGADKIDVLCQLVIDTLTESKDQLSLHEDFDDTVTQHFSGSINDAWFFSPNGLCFFFSPYDIAPYSAGVVVAEIPYEKLIGILKDDYFPAEQANAPGTINVQEYNAETLEQFDRYTELKLATEKNKFFITTNKAVHDITISVGTLSISGMYTESYTAYALSNLTLGDTIIVDADLGDGCVLQIKYYSGDELFVENIALNDSNNQAEILIND